MFLLLLLVDAMANAIYLLTMLLHAISVSGAATYAPEKTKECRLGNQSKLPRDAIYTPILFIRAART